METKLKRKEREHCHCPMETARKNN